jgi:mannan endo-1,6-alpha-mannosidase
MQAHNVTASIRDATAQYAKGLLSFYKGDASGLPKEEVGVFPKPPYVNISSSLNKPCV